MKKMLIIFLLLVSATILNAQFIHGYSIETRKHYRLASVKQGIDPGNAGFSFGVSAISKLHTFHITPGIEFGTHTISNYLGVSLGASKTLLQTNAGLDLEAGIKSLQGTALFQQKLLYLFGFMAETSLGYSFPGKNRIAVFIDLGYMNSPAYSYYSNTNAFFDLHAGLRYCFRRDLHD
ncbi:hypothetical protein ACFLT1_00480 [Bacteroidota bacterium]